MWIFLRKNGYKFIILIVLIFNMSYITKVLASNDPINIDKDAMKAEVERIYNIRSACLVSGDFSALKDEFDTSQKYGRYTLEHEIKRVKYLRDWTKQRGIQLKNIESTVRIKNIKTSGNVVKISLEESYKFDYAYEDDEEDVLNSFGVGIRHSASLTKKNDKWVIYNDWYTDCFEDALQAYTVDMKELSNLPKVTLPRERNLSTSTNNKKNYDREKAVAYADKYCGAAWGSTNNFKYNPKYMDFNGAGGDCTNYISQVLGDKEAGGLRQDGSWYCHLHKYQRGSGSRAWTNADGLKNYLVYSGKGRVIKAGTFKELTTPSSDNSGAPISKLQLGDLICYEKGIGNIDHFAVVTGFDSHGYPLINSHTTDRYHVPWDLGWGDKKIRFFLIHING